MSKELREKWLATERIYTGRIINVRKDTVELPRGMTTTREVVEHPGAVAIVALTDQNEIIFVEQYRRPVDRILLEIPAGKLEKGETPEACAVRELAEETGLKADRWEKITAFYTAPGFADEIIHLFLARDLRQTTSEPDEDEEIRVRKIPLLEAREMARTGKLSDAKTLIGVCLCPSEAERS